MANRGEGSNDHRAQGARQARINRLAELQAEEERLNKEVTKREDKLKEYVAMAAGNKRITINSIRDFQNLLVLLGEKPDWSGRVYIGRGISNPTERISVTSRLRDRINAHNSTHLGEIVQLIE